jgi:hypothetical protein
VKVLKKTIVAEVLNEIEKKRGFITPTAVVQEAADENSPLHNYFTWDDSKAAHGYRLWQARELITSVNVEIMGKQTGAFWNAKINIEKDQDFQAYFSARKVLSNKELYAQVLSQALTELLYWQKKYKELKELRDIVDSGLLARLRKSIRL